MNEINPPIPFTIFTSKFKILDWSKMKQIEDDIFRFDENSRKFSKRVENTVGKGEIAQCFQKACFLETSKGVIVWEWVKLQELQSQFVI